jgi:crotonobetainyl-CoA:carnitine CoA-transferase CaiB-like acyl-CoA transferase
VTTRQNTVGAVRVAMPFAQGEAGLMSLTGSGPDDRQRVGVPTGDLLAGMYGAYGLLAALHERERTGRGQVVRTSLPAVVGVHGFQGTAWTVAGKVGQARGNHHPSISPYGLFRCSQDLEAFEAVRRLAQQRDLPEARLALEPAGAVA